MKKIYIPRDNPGSYMEHPVPEDTTDWHEVDVADDFELAGRVYSPASGEFEMPTPPPQVNDQVN